MLCTVVDVRILGIVFKMTILNPTKITYKKKDFPFTVLGDLETTTGYISEVEGGSVFATSCCLMFNFHPKLNMTPITYLRSFGQTEKELKFITIPEKFGSILTRLTFNVSLCL